MAFGAPLARLLAALVASWVALAESAGSDQLVILSAAEEVLRVAWLQAGAADTGEGVFMGDVQTGTRDAPSHYKLHTSAGHAFRISTAGTGQPLKPVVHTGGLNVLVVGPGVAGGLETEMLGPRQLEPMTLRILRACPKGRGLPPCSAGVAMSPTLGVSLDQVVDTMMEAWSPEKNAPTRDQSDRSDAALIVASASATPLELRWVLPGQVAAGSPGAGLAESSTLVEKIAAVADEATTVRVRASKGDLLYFSSEGGATTSNVFQYPGEIALAGVAEVDGQLEVEVLDEDSIKVFLSDVARECAAAEGLSRGAEAVGWDGYECLRRHARLPRTGVLLPARQSRPLFEQLWSSWSHWRLCSHQDSSRSIRSMDLNVSGFSTSGSGGTDSLRVEVLREDPLVIAVRNFVNLQVCRDLSETAGSELTMATVGGSGRTQTSRARRTLTTNLWPDLEDADDVLTQVAKRFFEVARATTGLQAGAEGQEPINWLFYRQGYEYRPHCDGQCGSSRIAHGKRVASSLLYCTAAEDGGGTVFPTDGLKFQPSPGSFLLFAYNPDPKRLTLHAACPVLKGEKSTATQWYREGVSNEVNWDKYENWGSFPRPSARKRKKPSRQEI